jgi:hypothetical protein
MCSAKGRLIRCLVLAVCVWLLHYPTIANAQQVPQGPPRPGQGTPEAPGPLPGQPWPPTPAQAEPEPGGAQQVQPWSPTPRAEPEAPSPQQPQPGGPGGQQAILEQAVPPLFREFVPVYFLTVPPIGALEPLRPNQFAPPSQEGPPPDLLIQPFVTVSGAYTDNAQQTKNNRTGEFQTNIAPGIVFNYNRPQTSLNFVYNPSFYFPSNTEVDSNAINQYLSLRGAWNPGARLQFNIAEDYLQSNNSQDLQNPGSARTGTGTFKTNTVAATAAYVAPQFRTALTYTNQFTIDDENRLNNNMTNAGNLAAEITDQRTTYTGAYTLTRGDFSNKPNVSYWDQLGTGRVLYNLTPVINLTGFGAFQWHQQDEGDAFNYILGQARVGATFNLAGNQSLLTIQGGAMAYDPAQGETKLRPTFLIGWTQRLAYSSSVTASFESTYVSNFSGVSPTGLSYVRSASLILATNYFRDLTATLGGAWYWQNFAQTTPEGGPAGTKQETWSVQARVQYLFSRFLSMAIFYNLTDRTSGWPYLENIVGISATASYDFR